LRPGVAVVAGEVPESPLVGATRQAVPGGGSRGAGHLGRIDWFISVVDVVGLVEVVVVCARATPKVAPSVTAMAAMAAAVFLSIDTCSPPQDAAAADDHHRNWADLSPPGPVTAERTAPCSGGACRARSATGTTLPSGEDRRETAGDSDNKSPTGRFRTSCTRLWEAPGDEPRGGGGFRDGPFRSASRRHGRRRRCCC
jgi:hypothetical protein